MVESIEIIKNIKPRFFIFENVMAFQKTLCIAPDDRIVSIGEYIRESLGENYIISGRILNFMNYGSNSSRTRTLMIGVDKKYRNNITPYDLYPSYRPEKTLRDVIYDLLCLEWGEICQNDFYHAFRTYNQEMRSWIHDLKEGESAFDNTDPMKRPHRIVNGEVIENIRKNRDKYTRQPWDRFVQCVHTRNDQLAAQNTIHPEQDRVFSIREIMEMMTVPYDFKWVDYTLDELNMLSEEKKRQLYKENEVNIRQCLGEAVPTEIMRQLASGIKKALQTKKSNAAEVNRITVIYSMKYNKKYIREQNYITDEKYPSFLIYRNEEFDSIAENDGKGITHIPNYDVFLPKCALRTLTASRYINDNRVYLTPNMTYNPRVIENLPNTIPDGSAAVLIPKKPMRLTPRQKAHPNGNTSIIDKDYQYTCLIAKTESIRRNLMDNHGEPIIYDFYDFMFVLDTGLQTDYFEALPLHDFHAVIMGIEFNF